MATHVQENPESLLRTTNLVKCYFLKGYFAILLYTSPYRHFVHSSPCSCFDYLSIDINILFDFVIGLEKELLNDRPITKKKCFRLSFFYF